MDLENRVFRSFYPRFNGRRYFWQKQPQIKRVKKSLIKNRGYSYQIESESTIGGKKHYLINPRQLKKMGNKSPDKPLRPLEMRGLIAESIMRITLNEWINQIAPQLNITHHRLFKYGIELAQPKKFRLEYLSRNNILISKGNNSIAELDGLIEYKTPSQKGLLVLEAKSSSNGTYTSEINASHIKTNILPALNSTFTNHQIDFVVMAPKKAMVYEKRNLLPRIGELYEELYSINVGLIPFYFEETSSEFMQMAKAIKNMDVVNHPLEHEQNWFYKGGIIYLTRNGKIVRELNSPKCPTIKG